jgi:vesicular inhibitory amino acid transporter
MAVMGFTMFGDATASQITLNLPGQFLASKIAVWTTVGHHCSVHSLFQSLLFCHFLFHSLQFWLFILLRCKICIVGHLGPLQVVNPFTKYALTITPVAHSLEELLPQRPDSQEYRSWSLVIRTILVLSTIAVAVLVPFFGFVMAFIGAFLSMTVSVILPCACYMTILGKKATHFQVILCSTIIAIGVICLIGGTYSSVAGIIDSLHNG